jgi:hypothetical protein
MQKLLSLIIKFYSNYFLHSNYSKSHLHLMFKNDEWCPPSSRDSLLKNPTVWISVSGTSLLDQVTPLSLY